MNDFMIFKTENDDMVENANYNNKINEYADYIACQFAKGKKTLIITGSGISYSVPGMDAIMNKIVQLIENYDNCWIHSEVFERIFQDYKNTDSSERHDMQSRLLTYIQNAYMKKNKYVQREDLKPLAQIWGMFVEWLLQGDKEYKGVANAEHSKQHEVIAKIYKEMNAVSITTNFDNLLHKAFAEDDNFYPILDAQSFNQYYLSEEDDNSYIEIQSRGDAFWLECTGEKSKICPNRHRQCYVPGHNINWDDNKVKCSLCGSDAKIYFAFPGTKEKDAEMSVIIDGIWKYFANAISNIIVIGNSMDYDPVLIEFMKEMIRKRNIPVLYISRYKDSSSYNDIYQKEATKFLFSNESYVKNIWARGTYTNEILIDLYNAFNISKSKYKATDYEKDRYEEEIDFYQLNVNRIFGGTEEFRQLNIDLKGSIYFNGEIIKDESVKKMKHFSQLGLKTYWLHGTNVDYQEHNRFKHSIGVMLIASYLYLKISPTKNKQELKFLQLAALFHDLGHLPFSHLLEEVFDEFGWIPSGENSSFNHEQHTKHILEEIVERNTTIKDELESIHYSVEELQQLINGEFGIGYLDALINSPIDCDKIEYLFSDAIFMNRGTRKDFETFINSYVEDLSVNKENFLVLKKGATGSLLELIKMRGEMYDKVYLRSGLRYLEACCKLIIRTFIVYECTQKDIFTAVEDKMQFKEYYNLSDSKIKQVISYMESCLSDLQGVNVCELHVLEKMVEDIENNRIISETIKKTIVDCYGLIKDTVSDEAVKKIEEERISTFEVESKQLDKAALKELLKNVYLRFPGVILIDYVESKSSFSFGKRETRKRRNDGTKSATENILIKDIRQVKGYSDKTFQTLGDSISNVNEELHYSTHSYINVYRLTDNLYYYMQAEDYIIHELRKGGIIYEN